MKQCFNGAQLNGKGKWEPPADKTTLGLFNLGEEPSGVLKFKFTLDPVSLKELEKKIKKATDEGDTKAVEKLKRRAALPVETLEPQTLKKKVTSESMANNFFDMLI